MEDNSLAVILMGSPSDIPHVEKIVSVLDEFGVRSVQHIASAHKTPEILLSLLHKYQEYPGSIVFITVAGRSNALSGMVDANVHFPVIACPPVSSSFGGGDIYSSLRMPSGVAPMVVLEPSNAGLAAVKILSLQSTGLKAKVQKYQETNRLRLIEADSLLKQKEG